MVILLLLTRRKDPPCAFVSLKSLIDHETDVVAQSSTSVAEESLAPEWGETMRIYFSASQEVRAILKIIDFDDGDTLRTFQIETSQFKLGIAIYYVSTFFEIMLNPNKSHM